MTRDSEVIRERVRDLVMRHGWNPTCYQTVNPVFEYSFFPELDGLVAFVRARGRRVVAGSPICPGAALDEIAVRFRESEPTPVLYFGAGERVNESVLRLRKSQVVSLGAQPVWSPREWSDKILSHASVRYQLRRARNKGVVVREWNTEEAENSPALREILQEWLLCRGLPPLHFLVEPATLDYLKDRRTFVAEMGGEPMAFLNLCPIPQRKGWLTEQFPRRARAPNGTVDLLMHEAAQTVASEGAAYLTMGLVPFSSHGAPEINPGWLQTIMSMARTLGTPLYSFRGLDEFKSKFLPDEWETVYAASANRHFGFMDLVAVLEAFAGESVWRTSWAIAKKWVRSEV